MIGVPFYAVMPRTTSAEKIAAIEHYGGRCHFIDDGRTIYREAASLAESLGGIFIDQFTFAERATDWRGNNNIAESIFAQMLQERHPVPSWIVMSAGTGGTSATIGRYLRYRRYSTRLCVADVEHSAFFDGFRSRDAARTCDRAADRGRRAAEGRTVVRSRRRRSHGESARPASIAAMKVLSRRLGLASAARPAPAFSASAGSPTRCGGTARPDPS